VHEEQAHDRAEGDEQPHAHAWVGRAHHEESGERDRDDEIGAIQQRRAEQDAAGDREPVAAAIGRRAQRRERRGEPEQTERQSAVPCQRRQPDRRDDDQRGDDRTGERDLAPPRPREQEHPGDDADDLEQADHALDEQGHAEDLEHAGEDPHATGAVEVEEVAVRYVAAQEALTEDEHEALFHRWSGASEQAAERDRDDEEQDRDRDDGPLARREHRETGHRSSPVVRVADGRSAVGAGP